jgi:hypothetical protein
LRVFDAIASQDGQHLGSYATLVKKILETFKNGYDSSRDFPQLQAILTSHAASLPTPQFIIELWNADAHDYYNKDTGSMVGVGDFVNEGLWKPGDDGVHIGIPPEGLLRVSVLYGPNENYKLYMENGKIGSTANWKDLHPENQKVIESAEGNNKGDNGWYTKPGPQAGYVWHYAYFQISPTADGHPNGFSFDSIPP